MQRTIQSPIARGLGRVARAMGAPKTVGYGFDPDRPQTHRGTSAGDDEGRRQLAQTNRMQLAMFADMVDYIRPTLYKDYEQMLRDVPELKSGLKILHDHAFIEADRTDRLVPKPLYTAFKAGARPEVVKVLKDLEKRINPGKVIPALVMKAAGTGDAFGQLIFERIGPTRYRIARLAQLSAANVRGIPDDFGSVGSWQVSALNMGQRTGPHYNVFEILHVPWDAQWNKMYGTSMLETARKTWRREEAAQDSLLLAIMASSSSRLAITYPVPGLSSPDAMKRWQADLQGANLMGEMFDRDGAARRKLAVHLAMTNHILPYNSSSLTPPSVHDIPAPPIKELIEAVHSYQGRNFVSVLVPAALATVTRDMKAANALETQGVGFAKAVFSIQAMANAVWHDICTRELIAHGIATDATNDEYWLRMPKVERFDTEVRARSLKTTASTVHLLEQFGVEPKWALVNVFGMTEDEADANLIDIAMWRHSNSGTPAEPDTTDPEIPAEQRPNNPDQNKF